jgi:hypothetical protein
MKYMNAAIPIAIILIVVAATVVFMNWYMRRKGYSMPGETAVRCSKGHLFRTLWVEGGSLVSVRLGPTTRFHYCPVGKHWAIIHPVKEQDLTDEERRQLSV